MLPDHISTRERILLESQAWKIEKLSYDKNYFAHLDRKHKPSMLWITSNDTLTSIHEITNAAAGELMVYRNIGAQVRSDDLSLQAILQEAVEVHNVGHIMICCYSNCTGVWDTILGINNRPVIREWLKGLQHLYDQHYDELKDLPLHDQEKLLSEINIREQMLNVSKMECIAEAWQKGDKPEICGWYFDVKLGTIKEVFSLEESKKVVQKEHLFKMER
jgi:carbonic anhydrase